LIGQPAIEHDNAGIGKPCTRWARCTSAQDADRLGTAAPRRTDRRSPP
jgi:hypothetical protein